ncbi:MULTISPECIES: DUF6634 family protein [Rhizobium]|uniref:Uncharacterized protein n=1 Tax=Rhizobium gallicum bv. gallicum R602sp TaxID=1041138 RepID=A0A0B4X5C2_9HYPH|nr:MULTISPECIES: DUF6634 family protein [Rhizobium]AJD41707.1 hypothetical protein RGR602_CH02381 [Rhizobium gallicum bv. gallicum R602sp]
MHTSDSVFQAWFGMSRTCFIESLRCLADDLENVDQCAQALSPDVAINTWALAKRAVPCLIGRPIGHPSVADGKPAASSELFYLDPERGIARTMSRWYRLGTRVDVEYWSDRVAGNL